MNVSSCVVHELVVDLSTRSVMSRDQDVEKDRLEQPSRPKFLDRVAVVGGTAHCERRAVASAATAVTSLREKKNLGV